MDLDDELRRIFADDRLGVAVQPDAEQRIVAGARRLRVRRRLAATGAVGGVAVAALVAGAVLFTDPRPPDALPPAEHTTTTRATAETSGSSSAPSSTSQLPVPPATGTDENPGPDDGPTTNPDTRTQPPATTGTRIGPDGFGVLRLGMSFNDAEAAGGTEGEPPVQDGGCTTYPLLLDGEPAGEVVFGPSGVAVLAPTVDTHTADGVSTGWTADQVKAVYPTVTDAAVENGAAKVAITEDTSYLLVFAGRTLRAIKLQTTTWCP